jgi:hypothetical protein
MSTFLWILLAAVYLAALVSLGVTTLRKGHRPVRRRDLLREPWIIGALMSPTPRAAA